MFIDNILLEFVHFLNVIGGGFFTPFFRFVCILGEKSWFLTLIAVYLCLRKRPRWIGGTSGCAMMLCFFLIDFCLKIFIVRDRPYLSASNTFYQYWISAGSIAESGYSFPSGHVAGTTAFFFALLITCKKSMRKNIAIVGTICIVIMTLARMYFMHHYFTDCLGGFVLGILMAFVAKLILKLLHALCKYFEDVAFFNFVLNFDLLDLFRGNRG